LAWARQGRTDELLTPKRHSVGVWPRSRQVDLRSQLICGSLRAGATMIIYDQPPKSLPDFNGPIRSKNTTMVDEPARDQSTTAIVAGLVRGC
jgi:hypothetical protein